MNKILESSDLVKKEKQKFLVPDGLGGHQRLKVFGCSGLKVQSLNFNVRSSNLELRKALFFLCPKEFQERSVLVFASRW